MKKKQPHMNLPDDAAIRHRMENLHVPFDEQSWAKLSNSLDKIAHREAADADIKSRLKEVMVPYNEASWIALASRMNVSAFKKHITVGKVLELLFLILFLWWYPEPYAELNLDLRQAISNQKNADVDNPLKLSSANTYDQDKATPSVINDKTVVQTEKNKNASKYTLLGNHLSKISDRQPGRIVSSDHFIGNSTDDISHLYVSEKMVLARVKSSNFGPISLLPQLSISGLASLNQELSMPVVKYQVDKTAQEKQLALALDRVNAGKKARLWIGMAMAADRDLIRSPYPTQLSVNHMGRIEQNYHAQINVFLEYNFLEFQSGLIWQKKEYRSVYEGINDANIVGIPLNVRLKFNQAGIMRGYVMGGITAHFAAYANYQETELFMRDPSLFYVSNHYRRRESGLLPSSRYRNGILEGESLYGNQYYTANIAVGMEIYLHKSYRLFLEQAYFHNLDYGIGPAFDKFSTASTTIGFRYLLK
jgi:hypothetical protein